MFGNNVKNKYQKTLQRLKEKYGKDIFYFKKEQCSGFVIFMQQNVTMCFDTTVYITEKKALKAAIVYLKMF